MKNYEKLYNETLIELMNLKARVGSAIKTTDQDGNLIPKHTA